MYKAALCSAVLAVSLSVGMTCGLRAANAQQTFTESEVRDREISVMQKAANDAQQALLKRKNEVVRASMSSASMHSSIVLDKLKSIDVSGIDEETQFHIQTAIDSIGKANKCATDAYRDYDAYVLDNTYWCVKNWTFDSIETHVFLYEAGVKSDLLAKAYHRQAEALSQKAAVYLANGQDLLAAYLYQQAANADYNAETQFISVEGKRAQQAKYKKSASSSQDALIAIADRLYGKAIAFDQIDIISNGGRVPSWKAISNPAVLSEAEQTEFLSVSYKAALPAAEDLEKGAQAFHSTKQNAVAASVLEEASAMIRRVQVFNAVPTASADEVSKAQQKSFEYLGRSTAERTDSYFWYADMLRTNVLNMDRAKDL